MAKSTINLQDSFLNQVRKDNTPIDVVLLDGSQLQGHVRGFDNFTVIIQTASQQHLIYKHAIAQIVQARTSPPPRFQERPAQPAGLRSQERTTGGEARASDEAPRDKFNKLDLNHVKADDESK